MIGCVFIAIGILSLIISSFSYDWRAFTNKKAWGGKTLPNLKRGLFFIILGAILVAIDLFLITKQFSI
ncbi:hypothetical protein JFY71_02865 [Miniphocaeibacter halophilus]|uniref:Uncharacterized protein n=2 Tax=Miniphocaeibacter halophilus TaxID=2931922 RepID=A0AC61N4G7_9FIRM|nr:hypothetical protein JFY71_02865 [Miniphocaeibacter halophilus]